MSDLIGKTVLVTGASSGIGEATAWEFAKRGARVALLGRRLQRLEEIASELGDSSIVIAADVAIESEARRAVKQTLAEFAQLDFVVHAAGVVTPAKIEDLSGDIWRNHIDVNLNGAYYVMHECALAMREAGSGSITAIASDLSFKGMPAYAHYCASKAGLAGLVKSFALELAPLVRVNAVCPGPVDTPMMAAELEWFGGTQQVTDSVIQQVPLRRFASAAEIARFVVFVTVNASFTTGSLLSADGGTTAG